MNNFRSRRIWSRVIVVLLLECIALSLALLGYSAAPLVVVGAAIGIALYVEGDES